VGLPKPTLATVFEVVAEGKVYRVKGRGPPEVDRGATAEVAGAVGGTCSPSGQGWRRAHQVVHHQRPDAEKGFAWPGAAATWLSLNSAAQLFIEDAGAGGQRF
jgi:hypothetical protein